MELTSRNPGDILLPPGELADIRRRLRSISGKHDLSTVIVCAFDHRTRMLPFVFADKKMIPAGVRAIGSGLVDSGFTRTRIVLQQWNKNFSPTKMSLDGRVPDLLMISSMNLHEDECSRLIREAHKIDKSQRPLIITGGSKCIYEPFDLFSNDPDQPASADIVVTGEEYVVLNLLEVLLSVRSEGESLRSAFCRSREAGALNDVPGLVYAESDDLNATLVDTGMQRLVGDLDEKPDPVIGYGIIEPPGRHTGLRSQPVAPSLIKKLSPISSIVMTLGCKFRCGYCPIPAYNQRQYRAKSGQRIAEDMGRLNEQYGLRYFFGADDNFLNEKEKTLEIVDALTQTEFNGQPVSRKVRWHTEATVHDILRMKEFLPDIRQAGCRGLWVGVEDMTGTLVRKGQSQDKTLEAFSALREVGICPMPMMMHHDSQPLYTTANQYGLLNQIRLLRKAGAASLQVLMITPSAGSRLYEDTFESGQVYSRVGNRKVDYYMYDGNYVIASHHPQPWRKQLNLLAGYFYFYNPVWLIAALVRKSKLLLKPAGMQVVGMTGLLFTVRRTATWVLRLMFCKIQRHAAPPQCRRPVRGIDGAEASHAIVKNNGDEAP